MHTNGFSVPDLSARLSLLFDQLCAFDVTKLAADQLDQIMRIELDLCADAVFFRSKPAATGMTNTK